MVDGVDGKRSTGGEEPRIKPIQNGEGVSSKERTTLSEAQRALIAKSALLTSLPLPIAAAVALLAPLFTLRGPEAKERLAKLSSSKREQLEESTDERKEGIIVEEGFNIVSIDKDKGGDFKTTA